MLGKHQCVGPAEASPCSGYNRGATFQQTHRPLLNFTGFLGAAEGLQGSSATTRKLANLSLKHGQENKVSQRTFCRSVVKVAASRSGKPGIVWMRTTA
jgi:hypothetical protein